MCRYYLEPKSTDLFALMILARAADPQECSHLIKTTDENIELIISNHLENGIHEGCLFGVVEIMETISKLALNKSNARAMIKFGIIEKCNKIVTEVNDETEIIWTLKVIRSLCSTYEAHKLICQETIPLITGLEDTENATISALAKEITSLENVKDKSCKIL